MDKDGINQDNTNKERNEETDSSGSDYDETDGEMFKKAKRKILKVIEKFVPLKNTSEKYEMRNNKMNGPKSTDIYDFTHEKRGCCFIINNDQFTDMPSRPGSSNDVSMLKKGFSQLGFDVKIYNNLGACRMDKKLRKVCQKYDHEKSDCFVCIILSHGGEEFNLRREREDVVFGSDDRKISISDIMELFNDEYCPGLMGKPRLFFIQACRGEKVEKGVDIKLIKTKSDHKPFKRDVKIGTRVDSADAKPADPSWDETLFSKIIVEDESIKTKLSKPQASDVCFSEDGELRTSEVSPDDEDVVDNLKGFKLVTTPSPCYVDSLVMFSSPAGYFAFRRSTGSWLIKSLAHVLEVSDVAKKSFQQMLTHVSYEMAMNYSARNEKNAQLHGSKNVPCVISMLTKDIYFKSCNK